MKTRFVSLDPDKCTSCGICELACSANKEGGFNPTLSRIKIVKISMSRTKADVCRHCEDHPCVDSCPTSALSQDEKTGVIIVDNDKCNACGICIPVCPYGAIFLHPEENLVKICDLCDGDPMCIKFCPKEAISW